MWKSLNCNATVTYIDWGIIPRTTVCKRGSLHYCLYVHHVGGD